MNRYLRALGVATAAGMVWLVAAGEVPSPTRLPLTSVVAGAVVSQPFGCTYLTLEPFDAGCPLHHFHTGVDLAAPAGTEVLSATSGIARAAFDSKSAGLFVIVTFNSNVRVLYCHLSALRVISGEAVTPGQLVGLVGMTGLATGPHVHLEIDVGGKPVDPGLWLGSG